MLGVLVHRYISVWQTEDIPPLNTLQLLCRHHTAMPGAVGTAATEGLEPIRNLSPVQDLPSIKSNSIVCININKHNYLDEVV